MRYANIWEMRRVQKTQINKREAVRNRIKKECDALLCDVTGGRKRVEKAQSNLFDELFQKILPRLNIAHGYPPVGVLVCPKSALEMFDLFQDCMKEKQDLLRGSGNGARGSRVDYIPFVHEQKVLFFINCPSSF